LSVPIAPSFSRIGEAPELASSPAWVAIGNFDGVHLGHQAVLGEAIAGASAEGLPLRVLTFDPHPAVILGRTAPKTLTALPRKAELLARLGVERVLVKTFDAEFAAYTPERFASELLAGTLHARRVVVGRNFRFGHKRAGDLATLEKLGAALGFSVGSFELRGDEKGTYSSTRVRDALERGDLADASAVLGRFHAFSGTVARGEARGRSIGFPTANVEEVVEVVPKNGVYAVVVDRLEGASATALGRGVMNVGVRPTVSRSSEPRASACTSCCDSATSASLPRSTSCARRLQSTPTARARPPPRFSRFSAARTADVR
jgi:riboflavin kinase/FMN adenylyltransferase